MKLYSKQDQVLSLWLSIMCGAIVIMVFIGGLTRLTDSGLSMTDWKPVTGLLPPFADSDWQEEFAKYKTSPEYKKINKGMVLEEFKSIYWLEFAHRIAGRLTALIFVLPLIFFIMKGNIRGKDIMAYIFIGCLIGLQGVMGWYMVKSGLVDNPHVSHYRLALHLILAIFIYSLLFWQKMKNSFDIMLVSNNVNLKTCKIFFIISIVLVYLQIFLGGLVAGLDAGLIYNTYPLMGETFVPIELQNNAITLNSFNDHVFVQFAHRTMAIVLFVFLGILCRMCIKSELTKLKEAASFVLFAVTIQISLGILTLLYLVPISYAIAHQLGAIFLISSLLWGLFLIKNA